jgi:hypothetical protein
MTYKIPAGLYHRVVQNIDLAPSAEAITSVALWTPRCRVEVHFYPDPTPKPLPMNGGTFADLMPRIDDRIREQETPSDIALTVRSGTSVFSASPQHTQRYRASVDLQGVSGAQVDVHVQNTSSHRLSGALVVRSVNSDDEKVFLRSHRTGELRRRVETGSAGCRTV